MYCKQNSRNPSTDGYLHHFKEEHDMISRYEQGIINFQRGIRRNNRNLVQSAKYHTKELFYGRPHPIYLKIEQHTLTPVNAICSKGYFK